MSRCTLLAHVAGRCAGHDEAPVKVRHSGWRVGCVYLIQHGEDGPVKIGWALNPRARLCEMQVGSPVELRLRFVFPGPRTVERSIHDWMPGRIRGEWFKASPTFLDDLRSALRLTYMRQAGIGPSEPGRGFGGPCCHDFDDGWRKPHKRCSLGTADCHAGALIDDWCDDPCVWVGRKRLRFDQCDAVARGAA